jgi:hypothetical protein
MMRRTISGIWTRLQQQRPKTHVGANAGLDCSAPSSLSPRVSIGLCVVTGEFNRDEIVARVWGKGAFLDTDNSIRGAIRKLRQVLKDDAETPRFIQTVTGQGYRFIAPIIGPEEEHGPDASMARPAGPEAMPRLISGVDNSLQSRGLCEEEKDRKRNTDARADAESDREPRTQAAGRWFVLGGVALLALLAAVYIATRHRAVDAAPKIKSLAVLPLKNLSGDSTQDTVLASTRHAEKICRLP